MHKKIWGDEGGAIRLMMIISISIIMILVSIIGVIYYYIPSSEEPPPNTDYCLTDMIPTSFVQFDDTTQNNGGWFVHLCPTRKNMNIKWSDVTISIKHSEKTVMTMTNIENTADFNYTMIQHSGEVHWHLLTNGTPYFSDNETRTQLEHANLQDIVDKEMLTLENVTLILLDYKPNKKKIDKGDTIVVFRDNDGDGEDEIRPGMRMFLSDSWSRIDSVELY